MIKEIVRTMVKRVGEKRGESEIKNAIDKSQKAWANAFVFQNRLKVKTT